jgi:hypothetical protein
VGGRGGRRGEGKEGGAKGRREVINNGYKQENYMQTLPLLRHNYTNPPWHHSKAVELHFGILYPQHRLCSPCDVFLQQ